METLNLLNGLKNSNLMLLFAFRQQNETCWISWAECIKNRQNISVFDAFAPRNPTLRLPFFDFPPRNASNHKVGIVEKILKSFNRFQLYDFVFLAAQNAKN